MGINSYDYILYTISLENCALSPFDNKRYISEDGVSTLAYSHCKI
jgi:hypothetical protein